MNKSKNYDTYELAINELVVAYRNTKNEKYLGELIESIKNLVVLIALPYSRSIPNSEVEDLVSEGYMVLVSVLDDYDQYKGTAFTTLLKTYVHQKLNRIYNEATRQKRHNGSTPVSYESLVEINREGSTKVESYFTVECEDFNDVEFADLLESLGLNEKEQVVVNILISGGTKGEVAKALNCTPATANYYFKSIRKKFVFAGVTV